MKFTEEHLWITVEDGEIATIGLTDVGADDLGEAVFVDLPEPGDEVTADDQIVVLESEDATTDILCPLDGTIVEVNDALAKMPGLVNEDPMGDGWLLRLTLDDPTQLDALMGEAAYRAFAS